MSVVAFAQALIRRPVTWSDDLRFLTQGASAVFCNLEGCLPPPGCWPMKTKTVHPLHEGALSDLADLGVTHLSIANNHAWDYGHAGLLETRRRCLDAGFAVAGAGIDLAEAARPAFREGVAVLALDAGPTPDWAIAGQGPGVNPLRVERTIALTGADIARLAAIESLTGQAARKAQREAIGYDITRPNGSFYGLDVCQADAPGERWTVCAEDEARTAAGMDAARADADTVLVSIHYHHWPPDWTAPPAWLLGVASRLMDAAPTW